MKKEDCKYEKKIHGRIDFPYTVYMGRLPEFLRNFPLHWHDEFEIIWIERGEGYFRVLSQEFLCKKNDIVIIPPGCMHSIRQKDEENCWYFNILFKFELLEADESSLTFQKYFKPFLETQSFIECIRAGQDLNELLLPHIVYLVENRKQKFENQELLIKSHLFTIMNTLQGVFLKNSQKSQGKSHNIERLKPLIGYISQHYENDLSVADAAEMISMSPNYFMKYFKKTLGISFVNYLNQVRLEHAQMFLKNSSLNISEICEKCGFHNFSYFIRSFKKAFGITPKKYRS